MNPKLLSKAAAATETKMTASHGASSSKSNSNTPGYYGRAPLAWLPGIVLRGLPAMPGKPSWHGRAIVFVVIFLNICLWLQINDESSHVPSRSCHCKAKQLIPLCFPVTKVDLRGLGDARRIWTAVGNSSSSASFSAVSPWLTRGNHSGITEAECTSRIFTPRQKLPGGCKSAVMVISQHNGDNVVVLKGGENHRSRIGMCLMRT